MSAKIYFNEFQDRKYFSELDQSMSQEELIQEEIEALREDCFEFQMSMQVPQEKSWKYVCPHCSKKIEPFDTIIQSDWGDQFCDSCFDEAHMSTATDNVLARQEEV